VNEVVNPNDVQMRQFQAALRLTFKLIQQRTILNIRSGRNFSATSRSSSSSCASHTIPSAAAKHLDQLVAAKTQFVWRQHTALSPEDSPGSLPQGRRLGFGSALLANSDYRGHFGSRRALCFHDCSPRFARGSSRNLCFHFCWGWIVWNCINCNPVPRESEPSSRERFGTAASLRLTRGSSWVLGDRAKRCLSEDPAPALIQPCRR